MHLAYMWGGDDDDGNYILMPMAGGQHHPWNQQSLEGTLPKPCGWGVLNWWNKEKAKKMKWRTMLVTVHVWICNQID